VGDVDNRDGGTLWIASLLAGISAEVAAVRAGSVGVVGDLAVREGLGRGVPGPVGGEAAREMSTTRMPSGPTSCASDSDSPSTAKLISVNALVIWVLAVNRLALDAMNLLDHAEMNRQRTRRGKSNDQGDLRHLDLSRRVLGRAQPKRGAPPFGDDGGDGWGDKLHAWIFETPEENRVGRAANLQAAGAEVDQMAAPGAFVMGRNMFGPVRGEGKGWWATIRHSMLRSSCSRTTRAIMIACSAVPTALLCSGSMARLRPKSSASATRACRVVRESAPGLRSGVVGVPAPHVLRVA
jgi:hypothetical protein